jgi:hypothetical protein
MLAKRPAKASFEELASYLCFLDRISKAASVVEDVLEWRPSAEIRKRRSRARSWTLTSAFMHLSVTESCLRTRRPRTNACSRAMPRSALNALRAFTHPPIGNSEGRKKTSIFTRKPSNANGGGGGG